MSGYNPASNQTNNLPQSRIIFYDKRFIENLKAQTPFLRCAERKELPVNSGNQLELFINKYVTSIINFAISVKLFSLDNSTKLCYA